MYGILLRVDGDMGLLTAFLAPVGSSCSSDVSECEGGSRYVPGRYFIAAAFRPYFYVPFNTVLSQVHRAESANVSEPVNSELQICIF